MPTAYRKYEKFDFPEEWRKAGAGNHWKTGLNRDELATKLGISTNSLYSWENKGFVPKGYYHAIKFLVQIIELEQAVLHLKQENQNMIHGKSSVIDEKLRIQLKNAQRMKELNLD
jgi:uncharacterized protein YjcR